MLFETKLQQAIRWCMRPGRGIDPQFSLRTFELRPLNLVQVDAGQCDWDYEQDPMGALEKLENQRAVLLADLPPQDQAHESGRILLFYPEETLCDGAAHVSSSGYFDYSNIPPWDTWFLYEKTPDGRGVLYSWVPKEFETLARKGVDVNPEECLVDHLGHFVTAMR
jgi:hypothetical protein